MEVTLTKPFRCAPEGHTVVEYAEGATVTGRVAELAIAHGAAKKQVKKTPKPKVTKPATPDHEG